MRYLSLWGPVSFSGPAQFQGNHVRRSKVSSQDHRPQGSRHLSDQERPRRQHPVPRQRRRAAGVCYFRILGSSLSFDCIPSSTTDFTCSSSGPDRDLGVRAQRGGGAPGHPAAGGRAAGDGEPRGSPGPEDPRSHHRSPRQSHTQADGGVQGSGVLFPVRAKL